MTKIINSSIIESVCNKNTDTICKGIVEEVTELMMAKLSPGEITGTQLLSEPLTEVDYLVENLITRTGLGACAGGSDIGKSAFLRQLAICVAAKESSFIGMKLNPIHGSVIVVCSEDDKNAVSFLLKKQSSEIDPKKLSKLRFIFEWENSQALYNELDKRLTDHPADMVIIDCFSDVFGGDLKDTQQIRTFCMLYQKLVVKHKCYVMFLHHTGKRTESLEPSKNNLLAGQGFEAKMRLVLELRADLMQSQYRHLCIVKANGLPSVMKKESFVLQFSEQDMNFTNTGERVPFELLAKSADDGSKVKYEQAKELKEKGFSYEKIAETLGYGSKGSISKLFDKAQKQGW